MAPLEFSQTDLRDRASAALKLDKAVKAEAEEVSLDMKCPISPPIYDNLYLIACPIPLSCSQRLLVSESVAYA